MNDERKLLEGLKPCPFCGRRSTTEGGRMITDKERHERSENFRDMISARNYGIPGTVGSLVDIDDLLSELLGRRAYGSETAIDACEALFIADPIEGKN